MKIKDIVITSPFCIYDIYIGHYIFQALNTPVPVPDDIAALPVLGFRMMGNVLYIDTHSNI